MFCFISFDAPIICTVLYFWLNSPWTRIPSIVSSVSVLTGFDCICRLDKPTLVMGLWLEYWQYSFDLSMLVLSCHILIRISCHFLSVFISRSEDCGNLSWSDCFLRADRNCKLQMLEVSAKSCWVSHCAEIEPWRRSGGASARSRHKSVARFKCERNATSTWKFLWVSNNVDLGMLSSRFTICRKLGIYILRWMCDFFARHMCKS